MFAFIWRKNRRRTAVHQPKSRFRPYLEAMEDRCLPSGGVLDPTFGGSGIVTTNVGTVGAAAAMALAIYPQADTTGNAGKIVAAGDASVMSGNGTATNAFAVVRYNPAGTLDSSWGAGGQVITSIGSAGAQSVAYGVGIQGDGKVVAAGLGNGNEFAVVRYKTNGSLDTSFGSKGIILTNITKGSTDEALDMAIQPDGKILAAGITNPAKSSTENVALVRYNSDGSLDTSFGTGGKVTTAFASAASGNPTLDMAVYPSSSTAEVDKIVVVEQLTNSSVVVIRYDANGSLDTTFGNGAGYVTLSNVNSFPSVALQADDRIVVAVESASGSIELVRYNADGSLDPAFGSGGIAISPLPASVSSEVPRDVTIQANGEIIVAGEEMLNGVSGFSFFVARANSGGWLDTTFGTGGVATSTGVTLLGGPNTGRVSVALDATGRIDLAGTAAVPTPGGGNNMEFALARFLAAGPHIGSFRANPSPVTTNSSLTLTAGSITDDNPNSTITQVAFYVDSNNDGILEPGADTLLGYATQTSPGVWTFTFTVNLTPGAHTLFAQAEDTYGVFGDPVSVALTVQ